MESNKNCEAINPTTGLHCVLAPPHVGHRHWDRYDNWDSNEEWVRVNIDLLSAIHRIAPIGTQIAISDRINDIRWEGHSERRVALYLTDVLYDGLNHAQWPSNA